MAHRPNIPRPSVRLSYNSSKTLQLTKPSISSSILSTHPSSPTTSSPYFPPLLTLSFALGHLTAIPLGQLTSMIGRRPIALFGLVGTACCVFCKVHEPLRHSHPDSTIITLSNNGLGTFDSLFAYSSLVLGHALLTRFLTGAALSAVSVSVLAMLADVTEGLGKREKAALISRLPLIAAGALAAPAAKSVLGRYGYEVSQANLMRVSGGCVAIVAVLVLVGLDEVCRFLLCSCV